MTLTDTQRRSPGSRLLPFVAKYGTLVVLVSMIIGLSIAAPRSFATPDNFLNILSQISLTAIIAAGLTLPLAVGEFDLSVGYQASLGGVLVVGLITRQGLPIPVAIGVVVLVGALIGVVNGLVVTKLGVNALVATLGTGTIVVGLNYAYSGGIPVAGLDAFPEFTAIAQGKIGGLSNTVLIMAGVLAILWIVLNRTVLGQHIQAVGGNRHAARLAGVRVDRVRIAAFAIAGVCAVIAGLLLASRVGSGQITAGDGYLLNSFAAVFLGSAALRDGEFHILGTFIGVLTVGVGFNGLAILGAPTFVQFLFSGGLLIMAVALSTVARRYAVKR
ncbi:ABC transporter permease [Homoserinibacter sp. GY 40078]|uniref:ABC transporter permease n=1 Tax=Homoserinibacter sp. GY 40078 TaxID=2603275 RepID=UPI0011CC0C54|nr:ABC transporter permease [Homoserinibacter sp. GY 40078]TXK19250.1 ABC transporter permease [Homoserinibacter sp. GY 40078]